MSSPAQGAGWRLNPEYFFLVLLATLWGSTYLFIKVALVDIPPVTLIAVRVSIAALFLGAMVALQGHRLPRDLAIWGRLFIQAGIHTVGGWLLLAWGQQYVDSAVATVLNSTSPMFVFLLTLFVFHQEPTPLRRFLGAGLGVLGVTLIVGVGALQGLGREVVAQGAILFSALLYGGAAIHGRRFAHLPPMVTAAGTMIASSACLVPASLLVDQPWRLAPSAQSLFAALALGFFCTALAMMLYFRLIGSLGSMGAASQAYLRVGVGVGLGMIVLGEHITWSMALGIGLTIAGVVLINLPVRQAPPAAAR